MVAMKVSVNITDAELAAIGWLKKRPSTYSFEELTLRKRLVERFLERVEKAAGPRGTNPSGSPVRA